MAPSANGRLRMSANSRSTTPSAPSPLSTPVEPGSPDENSLRVSTLRAKTPLAPVHETIPTKASTLPRARAPPSSYRSLANGGSGLITITKKGKERAPPTTPLQQRPGRANWIVDPLEARRGQEVWQASERVILVLGEPTRQSLAPILYSEVYSNTLLLVGSLEPIPEIEMLTSPSQLLNCDTIYPMVQPFVVPEDELVNHPKGPIPAFLAYAASLADGYRRGLGVPASTDTIPKLPRSRRGSAGSAASGTVTPPGTPGRRFQPWSRQRSHTPSPRGSPNGSLLDLSRLRSSSSRAHSIMSVSTELSVRERLGNLLQNDHLISEGSPFDAVINFIHSPRRGLDTPHAMQEMLGNTVVLTTALMPLLTKVCTANSINGSLAREDLPALSLVHICPVNAPPTLAPVIERFLNPLIMTMSQRVRRDLFSVVTGLGAWLSPRTESTGEGLPGADTILFGGVRCIPELSLHGGDVQSMLAGWDHALSEPGALTEYAKRGGTPPSFSRRESSQALSEIRAIQAGGPLSPPMVSAPVHSETSSQSDAKSDSKSEKNSRSSRPISMDGSTTLSGSVRGPGARPSESDHASYALTRKPSSIRSQPMEMLTSDGPSTPFSLTRRPSKGDMLTGASGISGSELAMFGTHRRKSSRSESNSGSQLDPAAPTSPKSTFSTLTRKLSRQDVRDTGSSSSPFVALARKLSRSDLRSPDVGRRLSRKTSHEFPSSPVHIAEDKTSAPPSSFRLRTDLPESPSGYGSEFQGYSNDALKGQSEDDHSYPTLPPVFKSMSRDKSMPALPRDKSMPALPPVHEQEREPTKRWGFSGASLSGRSRSNPAMAKNSKGSNPYPSSAGSIQPSPPTPELDGSGSSISSASVQEVPSVSSVVTPPTPVKPPRTSPSPFSKVSNLFSLRGRRGVKA